MTGLTTGVKVTFAGNKKLLIGTLSDNGTVASMVEGRGLVSVDAMENQAESEAQYADDEVWTMVQGAPLLTGSMTFMQLNDDVRVDFFGQQEVTAKMGATTVTGFADVGSYPQRILQYLIEGTATMADGSVERAALLTVYPNAQVTSTPSKESETNTDGTSVVNWTADIQATATSKYRFNGKSQAVYEFQIIGDDAVNAMWAELDKGTFALPTASKP